MSGFGSSKDGIFTDKDSLMQLFLAERRVHNHVLLNQQRIEAKLDAIGAVLDDFRTNWNAVNAGNTIDETYADLTKDVDTDIGAGVYAPGV